MKQHLSPQNADISADHHPDAASGRREAEASGGAASIGGDPELHRLTMTIEELQAQLDKAQRRVERLLGERNQLGALLDKRDEQIQHLNRELGSRRAGLAGSAQEEPSVWRDLLPAFARKLAETSASARRQLGGLNGQEEQAVAAPAGPGFGRAPIIANHEKDEPRAVLAVLLFGLDEDAIRNLLPVIQRDCATSGMMPLALTDNDAFELLREQGMMFEYLPPASDRERFDKDMGWTLYLQRRLAIIRVKWQPARVIALGQAASDMMRLWRESPFEDIPLPAAGKA